MPRKSSPRRIYHYKSICKSPRLSDCYFPTRPVHTTRLRSQFMHAMVCIITVRKRSCGKVMFLHLSASACWDTPPGQTPPLGRQPPLWQTPSLGDTPSRWLLLRTVRILLECILVFQMKIFRWKVAESNDKITIARYDFKQQALLVHHACEFIMKSMPNPCLLTLQRTSNGTHKWNGKTVTEPNCKANAKAIFFLMFVAAQCAHRNGSSKNTPGSDVAFAFVPI